MNEINLMQIILNPQTQKCDLDHIFRKKKGDINWDFGLDFFMIKIPSQIRRDFQRRIIVEQ